MRYTRKEIDKTGKMMLTATNQETFKEAIEKLNDWRSLHLVPLDMLQQRLLDFLDTNNIHPLLVSRRLKRLTSIQYKLDLNPEMGLGGMQDIGGLRVVVNTVEELLRLHALLRSLPIADFECRRMYDYVNVPKETGYRSIHFPIYIIVIIMIMMVCGLSYRFVLDFNICGLRLLRQLDCIRKHL